MDKRSIQKDNRMHRARKLCRQAKRLERKGSIEHLKKATILLDRASHLGSGIAMLRLAEIYLNVDYPDLYNPEAALKLLERPANYGNASACYLLGKQLYCQNSHEEAVKCLSNAAFKGHIPAKALLGEILLKGETVEKNVHQGVRLLSEAAEAGNTDAQLVLAKAYDQGELLPQKPERGLFWAKQVALAGDVSAQMLVSAHYDAGSGCSRDVCESYFWMLQAAKQGNAYAQGYVGECLQEGRGVRRNEKKAFSYYEKAAAQGDLFALERLGLCYVLGRGVDKDKQKGVSLLKEAAESGYDYALIYLVLFGQRRVIPIEATEIEQYKERLEETGHAISFSEEPVPSGKRKESWVESEYDDIVFWQYRDEDYGVVEEEPLPTPFDPLLKIGKCLLAPISRRFTKE